MAIKVLERYRRAAVELRRQNRAVTKAEIARVTACSPPSVIVSINRQSWYREYIGVVSHNDAVRAQYRRVIKELADTTGVTTRTAIAKKMNVTPRAVQAYLRKHPDICDGLTARVVHETPGDIRYREAAERLRARSLPVTRKMLASELKRSYAAVVGYLIKNPKLAEEIGVIYTIDL